MKSFHVWKMTAIEEKKEISIQTANGMDIRYQNNGDELKVVLKGRLDTLSAPELMELLDKLSQENSFKQLVFDLEKLEYMSSTGLRVFLMMAKRLGSDNLYVDNANALVRDIFDTTGFSTVVNVK